MIEITMTNNNSTWAGKGFCQGRSIAAAKDWCNQPAVKGGEFCKECTCIIHGCKAQQISLYPLLPGEPRFCGEHHNAKYAGKYGCDFSGPDDFDIPDFVDDYD